MHEGTTLAGRYRLGELLGRGAAGSTWRAVEAGSGRQVVVKSLELRRLEGWKDVEALEREARVLRHLDHERIPRYVDSFREERDGAAVFVLVQEYIPGTSLRAWVASGWRGTETEIRDLGAQVLRILLHIHCLHPPLIHRDLNPGNLIRREDGQIFLVGFGGVEEAMRLEPGASTTVTGTPGYVPLEQYLGQATVRSDYYAFAATLLFLLSHRSPADFPLASLKIDFSVLGGLSEGLRAILANWLEPDEARRTLPPRAALALLEGREPAGQSGQAGPAAGTQPGAEAGAPGQLRQPRGSRVEVEETAASLRIRFRERGRQRLPLLGFTLLWLGFLAVWDAFALGMGAPLAVVLFSLPFWAAGLYVLYRTFYSLFGSVSLELSAAGLSFTRRFLKESRTGAPLADVGQCAVRSAYRLRNVPQYALEMEAGTRTLRFGEGLAPREQQWLAELVNRKLRELAAAPAGGGNGGGAPGADGGQTWASAT